jgi:archaellum component FlaC
MKAWVNTLLAQGYYTISDINGKVSALEALIADGDSNLQKQINEQKTALQQAKTDLTNEYKQYINQAIASGGIIDQAIATQVKKVQDEFQSKIDAINERLDALEDRLGKLEEDFVNRIQSLKYIPEYSDGKATMDYHSKLAELTFLISPKNTIDRLSENWSSVFDVYAFYTQTRAVNLVDLPITKFDADVDRGTITLTISGIALDESFYTEQQEVSILVQMSDGNTNLYSEYITLVPQRTDIIKFADKMVEQICIKTWDTDGDGKLSFIEASNVMEIQSEFSPKVIAHNSWQDSAVSLGNPSLTSFDEFQYFASVTSLPGDAFSHDVNLQSIILPASLTVIESGSRFNDYDGTNRALYWYLGAFAYTGLRRICLPENLKQIGNYAFMGSALTTITIPSGVTSIGDQAFSGCSSLKYVYCEAIDPPSIYSETFSSSWIDNERYPIVYVPMGSVKKYEEHYYWKKLRIEGYEF